jgi:hypothetical protein
MMGDTVAGIAIRFWFVATVWMVLVMVAIAVRG